MAIDFSTFGFKIGLFRWTVFSTCPSMFFPTSFKLFATTNLVTTISNFLLTAGHFLVSSGVVGFLLVVALHLVGNRLPIFITPLASLPLIIYGHLAFLLLCISPTVTVVSFLSLMAVLHLLIKIFPLRIAFIYLWPMQLSFLCVFFPFLPRLFHWCGKIDFGALEASPLLGFHLFSFGQCSYHSYVCFFLSSLGYFIGVGKSILVPWKQVPYLGFISDSEKQAFILLPHKKKSFLYFSNRLLVPKPSIWLLSEA